jgi:hypothetical protein
MQIDLLGTSTNPTSKCFLADLGDNLQLQPGTYQQMRIFLQDNSALSKPAGNQCGAASNCVVFKGTSFALQLSSEVQTGLKIPSGQIAGGNFTIVAGQTKDLNIDFDGCASVVQEGSGTFRLKPVLRAGEVSTTAISINGKVVDKLTGAPITSGKAIVALEQKDTNSVDRVIMQTLAGPDGTFVFCPVATGTYDVVIVAMNTAQNISYGPLVITGVQPGNTVGNILISAQQGTGTSQSSGSVTGAVTSTTGTTSTATSVQIHVLLSVLESVSIGSDNINVTIPLLKASTTTASATLLVTTQPGTTGAPCTPNSADCVSYTVELPAQGASVGTFAANGITLSAPTAGLASYTIEGQAFTLASATTADCTPPVLTTPQTMMVAGGPQVTAQPLNFTGCH